MFITLFGQAAEKDLPVEVAEVAKLWSGNPISGEIGYGTHIDDPIAGMVVAFGSRFANLINPIM